jgi:hypothetical protein
MLQVACKSCGTQAFTENDADPDSVLVCPPEAPCCKEDHHHGNAANESGQPCRPVLITVLPGSVTMHRASA